MRKLLIVSGFFVFGSTCFAAPTSPIKPVKPPLVNSYPPIAHHTLLAQNEIALRDLEDYKTLYPDFDRKTYNYIKETLNTYRDEILSLGNIQTGHAHAYGLAFDNIRLMLISQSDGKYIEPKKVEEIIQGIKDNYTGDSDDILPAEDWAEPLKERLQAQGISTFSLKA